MLRYIIPVLLVAGLLWLFKDGLSDHGAAIPSSLIGEPAPSFSRPRLLDGNKTISSSDIAGKVVIINAWASWCKACWAEHPLLMELSESQPIPIYGLNFRDRHVKALSMIEQVGNPYVASAFDLDGTMGMAFGVEGLPTTILVDADGTVLYKYTSTLTREVWDDDFVPRIPESALVVSAQLERD